MKMHLYAECGFNMIKNNVLIGKDNWLFLYDGGQKQFDYLLGKLKVSDKVVSNFVSNIEGRVNYFRSNGIKFRHVVFPSKPLVKNSFLPEDYAAVSSLFESYFKENLSYIERYVLHPLDILKAAEEEFSTFHKYNTHNSDLGYIAIIKFLLQSLQLDFNLDQYVETIVSKEVGGDLTKMLGSTDMHTEDFVNLLPINCYSTGNREFLPGNTNDVWIVHNFEALTPKRLLIFGDSFFKGTLKFLKLFFSEILYIRSPFVHKDIVENYQPDIVFTGNAERYMCNVDSDDDANNFTMSLYGRGEYNPSIFYRDAFEACLSYKHYPRTYEAWLKKINTDKFENQITINHSFQDADILRDIALYFEKNGDIVTAHKLMKEALKKRPDGSMIRAKYDAYKKWIDL